MKLKIIFILGILLALALSFNFILAEANYCCEKTTSGAWCQNDALANCDTNYKTSPTACDSTSYCKRGCCFDSQEGICMESTPQRVCEDADGTWADDAECGIIQCKLGCCILADQAAFVTMTRCKQLSGFYGLNIDFRSSITNELTCIATAHGAEKGACVYQDQYGSPACKVKTRAECPEAELTIPEGVNATITNQTQVKTAFYAGYLCTAEELGTICSPNLEETTIIEGKDEVYFTDTCGNIANIYDASKIDDDDYWRKIYKKSESCGYGSSNAFSSSCGNCDYYYGSIAAKATRKTGYPTYGDYICIDLNCKDYGKRHGESWCVYDAPSGNGKDPVGSRYFKEICIFGEVITEPCADFRNEICIEGEFGGFTEAACRTNRWQDCVGQKERDDCENTDVRDCKWIEGYYFSSDGTIKKSYNGTDASKKTPLGLCVPNYPPGNQFYTSDASSAGTITKESNFTNTYGTGYVSTSSSNIVTSCSMANAKTTFKWERTKYPLKLFGDKETDWKCQDKENMNCHYLSEEENYDPDKFAKDSDTMDAWARDMNNICYQLGDCGGYINFAGVYTEEGYAAYFENERVAGAGGAEILETTSGNQSTVTSNSISSKTTSSSTTGRVIQGLIKSLTERN